MENELKKSIVIIGPTASGKTKLSLTIAKTFNLNIVNADTRQFWKNIVNLSCSPTKPQKEKAKHFLFNELESDETPDLGFWVNKIKNIKNKLITGGNCFYVKNLSIGIPSVDISQKTIETVNNIRDKYKRLKEINPSSFIHYNDIYRITSFLNFYYETGKFFETYENSYKEQLFVIKILPEKEEIENNIKIRTNEEINNFINEIQNTEHHPNYESIIGYKEIRHYLNKKVSKEALIDEINLRTFQYAKYQCKFLKKLPYNILINNIDHVDYEDLEKNIRLFL